MDQEPVNLEKTVPAEKPSYGMSPSDKPLPPHQDASQGFLARVMRFGVIRVVVALVAVGGGSLYGLVFNRDAGYKAHAGDCIIDTTVKATDAQVKKAACSDPNALYEVGLRQSTTQKCPGEDYVTITRDKLLLCLALNVHKGQCIEEPDNGTLKNIACTLPPTNQRFVVTNVLGTASVTACGKDLAFSYPTPARTVCFRPVGAKAGTKSA